MKEMLKNKGMIAFATFMIGISCIYSINLKKTIQNESINSEYVMANAYDNVI